MPDEVQEQNSGDPAEGVGEDARAAREPSRGLRDMWQIPTLLAGVVLIGAGILASSGVERQDDFAGVLDDVGVLIQRNEFDDALGVLNGTVLPRLDDPDVTPTIRQRFHMLRGDAVSLGQSDRMINNRENNQLVVNEYLAAERLLAELGPDREGRMAGALISLGRLDEADHRVRGLPETHVETRRGLEKRLIEGHLLRGVPGRVKALEMLSTMAADSALDADDRVWALARQAELRIDAGYPEEALEGLLRAVHRLERPDSSDVGSLYLLLARTYHELGRLPEASEQITRADRLLPEHDPRRGLLMAIGGEIAQMNGDLPEARDLFWRSVEEHPQSDSMMRALMGVAEVDAELGDTEQSLAMYERLVEEYLHRPEESTLSAERIAESLLTQRYARSAAEDHESAIEFVRLADRLFDDDVTPAAIVLARAEAHRSRAEQLVAGAGADPSRPVEIAEIDPVTRAEIRANYLDAGENYLRHARLTVLSDDLAFTDSLWMAGDSYDLGGETSRTIEVFSEYAGGSDDDPRLPTALYRLAGAHQSRSEYDMASELYRELLDEHPHSTEASAAYVRLAQCRALDNDPDNDTEARGLLERILSSGDLAPDAVEFRDALVQLGRIHLGAGRYTEAAAKLGEALERYPTDHEATLLEFQLGDALRLSGEEVGDELARESMPAGRRRDLEARREERLSEALEHYESVRSTLDAIDARRRDDFQEMLLRNAHFYRADCAYDLGEYDTAIQHYDAAAQRYAGDPSSLVAMVQIVNCYVELSRWQEARTANERARRRLRELPPEALDAPDLPMTRRHWERWLDASAAIDAVAEAEND